jgi:cytochrome c oxidase assembly protein subunit 15
VKRAEKLIVTWLLTGCFLIYVMVVVGGLTRLTHSGLSMVEWKPAGSLPPMNDSDWCIQFDKYKSSPEFKLINKEFSLDDFKHIFWFEFVHRFIGRTIGMIFLIPFFYFLFTKKFPPGFLKKMIILLIIGGLQGLLGWFMVKSGLVKNPYVSHYRLAAHLITAFTAFGFAFWFALDLIYPKTEIGEGHKLKKSVQIFFMVVVLQIIYGAFVAGLKAGYLFPTFPKMGDNWIPSDISALKPLWRNFLEGQSAVQFVHRCIAYVVLFLTVRIFFLSRKLNLSTVQKRIIFALLTITSLQILLGIFTVLFSVPVSVALLHQTGAFFLFSIILFLLHRLRNSDLVNI